MVVAQVALPGITEQRENGALLASLAHLLSKYQHANEVGPG